MFTYLTLCLVRSQISNASSTSGATAAAVEKKVLDIKACLLLLKEELKGKQEKMHEKLKEAVVAEKQWKEVSFFKFDERTKCHKEHIDAQYEYRFLCDRVQEARDKIEFLTALKKSGLSAHDQYLKYTDFEAAVKEASDRIVLSTFKSGHTKRSMITGGAFIEHHRKYDKELYDEAFKAQRIARAMLDEILTLQAKHQTKAKGVDALTAHQQEGTPLITPPQESSSHDVVSKPKPYSVRV
jgi:hypothetical protein